MLTDDFSETMEVREKWDSIFRVLREKKFYTQELYILKN